MTRALWLGDIAVFMRRTWVQMLSCCEQKREPTDKDATQLIKYAGKVSKVII